MYFKTKYRYADRLRRDKFGNIRRPKRPKQFYASDKKRLEKVYKFLKPFINTLLRAGDKTAAHYANMALLTLASHIAPQTMQNFLDLHGYIPYLDLYGIYPKTPKLPRTYKQYQKQKLNTVKRIKKYPTRVKTNLKRILDKHAPFEKFWQDIAKIKKLKYGF